MTSRNIIVVAVALVALLVLIQVLSRIRGDPIERERLNPEDRPRVELQQSDHV